MSKSPKESRESAAQDRRDFIKGAAVAGVIGAVGAAAVAAGAEPQASASDPRQPSALGQHAMLDGRFPITYEDSVPEGVRVLTAHFKALSQRDIKGVADTLHFPFGTVEGTEPMKVDTAEEFIAHAPASLNMSLTSRALHRSRWLPEGRFLRHSHRHRSSALRPGEVRALHGLRSLRQ